MESAEELVKKFQKLAYKMASRFYYRFPKSKEDIQSAALEGLCQGVRDIIDNKKYEYAGAIVYINIRQKILEEIRLLPLIPIPTSLIKKKRLESYIEKRPFRINELYPEVYNDPDFSIISQITYNGFAYVNFKEIIEELKLTQEESRIIELRLEEQTVREIAQELGCGKSKIQNIIEGIRTKWKRKFS